MGNIYFSNTLYSLFENSNQFVNLPKQEKKYRKYPANLGIQNIGVRFQNILEIQKIMDENTQAFHKIKEYPTEFLEYSFKKNIDSEHLQIKSPGNQAEQAFFSYFLAGYPSVFLTIVPFQI